VSVKYALKEFCGVLHKNHVQLVHLIENISKNQKHVNVQTARKIRMVNVKYVRKAFYGILKIKHVTNAHSPRKSSIKLVKDVNVFKINRMIKVLA